MEPIWKDRVWLTLLLGPFVWADIVMLFNGWSLDGERFLTFYAQGMCISVALVSMFLPVVRGRAAPKE